MPDSETLLELVSPNGNVLAMVEQYADCCYFYLHGDESSHFGVKSCWVRNLQEAPLQLNVEAMREGQAPMLPRAHCAHPEGLPPLRADELDIIWAEEGDAAALTVRGELTSVIPSWSGHNGFHGYAKECITESTLCWPLGTPDENAQHEKYARAKQYWDFWSNEPGPWETVQADGCQALETCLGKHSNYYAIDGGNWPPKALLRIPTAEGIVLATVGVCLRPQPNVEMHFEDPAPHRRIELGIGLDVSTSPEVVNDFGRYISAQTNLPWSQFTFLGPGHTLPCDVAARFSGKRLPFALLVDEELGAPRVPLAAFDDDPVRVLWLIPISTRERKLAQDHGSAELIMRLRHAGVSWIADLSRAELD